MGNKRVTLPTAHKKTAGANIYEVTVEGHFVCNKGTKVELEPYRETARCNDRHRDAGFLSVFKNHILPEVLPKKHPGYTGLYTHNLVSVVNLTNPNAAINDPDLMSLEELVGFVKSADLPLELGLYQDAADLRQAIKDYYEDPEAFLAVQENRMDLRRDDLELKAELADLNPRLPEPELTLVDQPNIPQSLEIRNTNPEQTPGDTLTKDPATGELVPTDEFDENKLKRADDSLDDL